ncbi:MAG: hypothetical protein HY784_12795 [Chloroflexi bacterium]|nr:hypothetical protein [Chloroflexota bacterium]
MKNHVSGQRRVTMTLACTQTPASLATYSMKVRLLRSAGLVGRVSAPCGATCHMLPSWPVGSSR